MITAESEGRGRGSIFTVTLPVRAVSADAGVVRGAMGNTFLHRDRLRGVQIVLVDDDHEARKMVAAVLRAAGAAVVSVDAPATALESIAQHQPDLVVTDIAMPEMDGYAFTRALRARNYAGLKIVALSAFPASAEERRGFDAYLSKPIDPFQLVAEVARVAAPAPV
jgi:CheY-like chemotaxis protein